MATDARYYPQSGSDRATDQRHRVAGGARRHAAGWHKVRALVPQLYVRLQPDDIDGSGTVLSAATVAISSDDDIINSGTIAGRDLVAINANYIRHIGGRISAAEVHVEARNDIEIHGADIAVTEKLRLQAERDIKIQASRRDTEVAHARRSNINRGAALLASGKDAVLNITAQRDLQMDAAEINNAGSNGNTTLSAGRNLGLGTVSESHQRSTIWDHNNQLTQSDTQEIGSSINSAGNLELRAGNNVQIRAADIDSDGNLSVTAGNKLTLENGVASSQLDSRHRVDSNHVVSSSSVSTVDQVATTSAIASTLTGNRIDLAAAGDMRVQGSNVIAVDSVTLGAGKQMQIEAAVNTRQEHHERHERQSGIMSGDGGLSIGSRSQKSRADGNERTQSASRSVVGATQGDVKIRAGTNAAIVGSDIIAGAAADGSGGNIAIAAQEIRITPGQDQMALTTSNSSRERGIGIGLVGTPLDTFRNLQSTSRSNGSPYAKAQSHG